nr:alcohol dehydrogenase catalytic domain-containing protein [Plantibacter sp. VKM Ac-2880]
MRSASRRSPLPESPLPTRLRRRVRIVDATRVVVETVAPVEPGAGEAVVRVESCGLCGSDATMFAGRHPVIRPPIVPGHEIVGMVSAVGDGADELLGRRVAVLPQLGCGVCRQCRRGHARLCADMRLIGGQVDGGAADEVTVPAASLVIVPEDVPASIAPIVEPLAVARHAVSRVDVADAEVLVVGGGPIGLLVALCIRADGARSVTLVEPVTSRQEIVTHFGIPVVDALPDDGPAAAEFDVVFDCVGGALPERLLGLVAAGGSLVLVGVAAPELSFDGMLLQRQERTILGSHMYSRTDFEAALRLLAEGLLPTDAASLGLLFDRRPLDDAVAAFDDLVGRRSPAIKMLLIP